MILLQGHSISPLKKIPLETMSLQMKEREGLVVLCLGDMIDAGRHHPVRGSHGEDILNIFSVEP